MPGQLYTGAESTWPALVTVNRCGQQTQYCDARGLCQRNESILKPVFLPISMDSLCLHVTQIPRFRDVAIFVPTTDDDDKQNQLLYPLHMCAG